MKEGTPEAWKIIKGKATKLQNGQADSKKIKDLIREIEIGLWDNYLFYDYESFTNIRAQHNLANVVQNMIMMNQQQANTNNAKSAEDTKEE